MGGDSTGECVSDRTDFDAGVIFRAGQVYKLPKEAT
jgi:hypothetical protein